MDSEVLTVSEARADLPGLVARTVESQGAVIYLGARRRRQAALINAHAVVPEDIRRHLLTAFAYHQAELSLSSGDVHRGHFVHAGDPIGKVVAWLWRSDAKQFEMFFADYVHAFRVSEKANAASLVTLDDVLHALRYAMPADFERNEYEEMCGYARQRVPGFLGYQPN